MTIRKIQTGDLNQLLSLCKEHAEYEQLLFHEKDQIKSWNSSFFTENPSVFGWVHESKQLIDGYMTATIDYSTWEGSNYIYMDCLCLRSSLRGKGIGRSFLQILIDFAKAKRCKNIQWHTPPNNEAGINFYRKIGAGEKNKLRFYLDVAED